MHPTWIEGLIQVLLIVLVPIIVCGIIILIGWLKNNNVVEGIGIIALVVVIIALCVSFGSGYVEYNLFQEPYVNEATITVQEWQPRVGIHTNDDGMMVVDSADDLMLVDTEGNCYYNTENFWFGKFDTRDVFNQLKVNGTYKIKYYGWREGFNNGFPNILSVEQIINENNTHTPNYSDYFGVKLVK